MKNLVCVFACLLVLTVSFSQTTRIKAEKYPSLLWEITGKGAAKPSYLFGTMHVSSKMVFHLSDSFYLAIRNAQVVALETNPGTWQEDFSRYDLDGDGAKKWSRLYGQGKTESTPQDFLSINTLKLVPYEKAMEAALYSNPSIINSFLYRSNSETSSDFEEDTYLDLHIFQTGRKLGKRVCGVEDFDGSMQLVKEAYADAAKDKKKSRNVDYDDDFSYSRMEEAYRTGNLDLLDTINKVNSQSAAFDEKFLYRRNEIQAASIDSILKSGTTLFVGVGAAHLPGGRGVIELLRRKGYKLRPIRMTERNSLQKEAIEKIRVPVQFSRQVANDGFYSVSVPGKLYNFGASRNGIVMKQFADMVNGSYYMVTRFATHAALLGQSEAEVTRKLDSVMYENIPGKILIKKSIVKNGYPGYDITNRTRRGDVQRYNIFVTPFEIIIFRMSGNGEYVRTGTEAEQFFGSIQLKELKPEWKKWSPSAGGFEVELPHAPLVFNHPNQVYAAYDAGSKTAFEVIRTDIHNYDFLEEDSFDLELMDESFASSECIARNVDRQWAKLDSYPALDATYKYKDSTVAMVRFLIQGPHYYTLVASAPLANAVMTRFLKSFAIRPFIYTEAKERKDTALQFRVQSPVVLEKKSKLQMYPDESYFNSDDADDSLIDNGTFKSRIIESDSTGEKIYVSFFKPSAYYFRNEKRGKGTDAKDDSTDFKNEWIVRKRKVDTLANGLVVTDYELGNRQSSRLLKGKFIARDGIGYKLETELDTLSAPSTFVSSFFRTFEPLDLLNNLSVKKKKTALFFSHFFSSDTLLHKKAIKNINTLAVDSSDFAQLKRCIESLTWKEKKYLSVKKDFIGKLASLDSREAADFLKTLYFQSGDTIELQYAALEALLGQHTAYSFQTFGQIMKTDPPVMDVSTDDDNYTTSTYHDYNTRSSDEIYTSAAQNGSFLDNLTDSLQLTSGIFKDLLPLININDYEQPLLVLMGDLVDSNLIYPADYEAYLPKFILEAKQSLKKQLIQEKARDIAKAKKEDEKNSTDDDQKAVDPGNNKLSLYATLILPFWEQNPQVPQIIGQLLQSSDKRLRYNTMILLLRNNRPVADSMLSVFASLDEFRYELYDDLKTLNKANLFPVSFKDQRSMARSRLLDLQDYNKPDTLVYLEKLPLQYKDRKGLLYFFKYKDKKEDNSWKIATAGLFPQDSTTLEFGEKGLTKEDEYNFTELGSTKLSAETPLKEQLEKLRKKLLYSRRKSAAQFYTDSYSYSDMNYARGKY
jgi:uncharacterized protein YbaP (TraB family)